MSLDARQRVGFSIVDLFKRNRRIYLGNASSVRDYRAQLRGNRAATLWSLYLALMILIASLSYYGIVHTGTTSIARIQMELYEFYQVVMALLGAAISLFAPALTASAVVAERQRRSLDLVFSAPVEPKYYLVGKMLSSYRYIWMLLILALPVMAVSVVMGGATWMDVLAAFIMLSAAGLVFASIGLLMSTIATTPVNAVLGTYLWVILYTVIIGSISSGMAAFSTFATMSQEASFIVGLSPFTVAMAAPTYTMLFGVEVPNWILVLVYSLLFSKLMLLGAASILSHYNSPETKSLRIHGLVYMVLLNTMLMASFVPFTTAMFGMGGAPMASTAPIQAVYAGWVAVAFSVLIPWITCFGWDAERKFRPDGVFSWRRAFRGTPAGALPYLILMWLAFFGTISGVGWYMTKEAPTMQMAAIAFWSLGFWFLWWAVARWTSATALGLKGARTSWIGLWLLALGIPLPVMGVFVEVVLQGRGAEVLFPFYILYPILATDHTYTGWLYGGMMIVAGCLIWLRAERNLKVLESRWNSYIEIVKA